MNLFNLSEWLSELNDQKATNEWVIERIAKSWMELAEIAWMTVVERIACWMSGEVASKEEKMIDEGNWINNGKKINKTKNE